MTGPENKTISGLTAVTSISGSEVLPVDQSSGGNTETKKATVLQVLAGTVGDAGDATKGASLIGYKSPLSGAVATTLYEVARREVSIFDFLSDAKKATVRAGTATDIESELDAAIDACCAVLDSYNPAGGEIAMRPGVVELVLEGGIYTYSTTKTFPGSIVLKGRGGFGAAVLHYTGASTAIVVNSTDAVLPGTQNTRVFEMDGVALTGPTATTGVYLGSPTFWATNFKNGGIYNIQGPPIDTGESVYFMGLDQFQLCDNAEGLYVGEYCDLFTVKNRCFFFNNVGPDLILACPTASIHGNDFEYNDGGTHFIEVRQTAAVAAKNRNIMIFDNRFGPEGPDTVDYDIVFANDGAVTSAEVTTGVHLWGNKHFSAAATVPAVSKQKTAPILLDSRIANSSIVGGTQSSYSSSSYVVATTVANVFATGAIRTNHIDNILRVASDIRGIFQNVAEDKYLSVWTDGTGVLADRVCRITGVTANAQAGDAVTRKVANLTPSATAANYADAIGIATYSEATAERPVWIAGKGTVYVSALNTSGAAFMDPVYLGASGAISLTPGSGVPFIVGRVMSVANPGAIMVTLESWAGVIDVASAAGTITLTRQVPGAVAVANVTGTDAITGVTATGWTGKIVVFKFASTATMVNGGNLLLSADAGGGATDTLTAFCDGTDWFEIGRSNN